MAARAAAWSLVALATLTIGVGGAVGHAAATTTTVRVQVIGRGVVSDNKSSMNCGNGATVCRISYSGTRQRDVHRGAGVGLDVQRLGRRLQRRPPATSTSISTRATTR